MLEVFYHLAMLGGDRISSATGAEKNVDFLSIRYAFSVTLFLKRFSVTLVRSRF